MWQQRFLSEVFNPCKTWLLPEAGLSCPKRTSSWGHPPVTVCPLFPQCLLSLTHCSLSFHSIAQSLPAKVDVTNVFSNVVQGAHPSPNQLTMPGSKHLLLMMSGQSSTCVVWTKKPTRWFFFIIMRLLWVTPTEVKKLPLDFGEEKGGRLEEDVTHENKQVNVKLFLLPSKKD